MVNYPTILNLPQEDINRQLYEMIVKLQNGETGETADITALKTAVGDSNSGLVKDVTTLKTTVGDNDSGLVKDVTTLKTTVGDATSGIVKSVADINTEIGDETTSGTILYRIKTLEDG